MDQHFLRKDTPSDNFLGDLLPELEAKEGVRLPTNGEVLSHFLFLNRVSKQEKSKDNVIKVVLQKVKLFWDMAAIPTKDVIRSPSSKIQLLNLLKLR